MLGVWCSIHSAHFVLTLILFEDLSFGVTVMVFKAGADVCYVVVWDAHNDFFKHLIKWGSYGS